MSESLTKCGTPVAPFGPLVVPIKLGHIMTQELPREVHVLTQLDMKDTTDVMDAIVKAMGLHKRNIKELKIFIKDGICRIDATLVDVKITYMKEDDHNDTPA